MARNNIISLTCVIFCSLHSYILRQPPRIKPPGQFDAYLILIHLKDCYIFPCMWYLSITRTILCRVISRTPPAQGAGERDYGFAPCNPVFLSTFSCPALPGNESGLVDYSGLAIWAVNIVKIKFRPGFQILFLQLFRRGQRFPCWLRVFALLLVVFDSLLLRERFMLISLPWSQPEFLWLTV